MAPGSDSERETTVENPSLSSNCSLGNRQWQQKAIVLRDGFGGGGTGDSCNHDPQLWWWIAVNVVLTHSIESMLID